MGVLTHPLLPINTCLQISRYAVLESLFFTRKSLQNGYFVLSAQKPSAIKVYLIFVKNRKMTYMISYT